jgi:hypothetical protein
VWARHRADAGKLTRAVGVRTSTSVVEASALPPQALIGQPWAVTHAVMRAATAAGLTGLSQRALDSHRSRDEGWTFDERLIPTDAEVIGAARILSRRAGVTGLRFLLDEEAGSDAWLLRRVKQAVHKPVEPLPWRDVVQSDDGLSVFLTVPVD